MLTTSLTINLYYFLCYSFFSENNYNAEYHALPETDFCNDNLTRLFPYTFELLDNLHRQRNFETVTTVLGLGAG
jgi:hypothetical protein